MKTPPATRRRGSALEAAIFEAALEQLGSQGYAKLTMESVASAAQTGKAALYRRWSSLEDLLGDALEHALPSPAELPVHDDLREDLLTLLRCYKDVVNTTHGAAFQILKDRNAGLLHSVVRNRVVEPLRGRIAEALERAVERGEVRPDAVIPRLTQTGPAMVMYYCVTTAPPIPDEEIVAIVDDVLLPALRLPGK